MANNASKRGWLVQQDEIICKMISASGSDKFKWVEVSQAIFSKTGRTRSGKQCRQRWQHQLNPTIVRDQWTHAQLSTLFQMQIKFGNKWAQIAQFLPGRTDNAVKNFFYSSVRRVLTKINLYLAQRRNCKSFKSIREFQNDYLSKLMAVVDGHYDRRVRLSGPQTLVLARKILDQITKLIESQHFNKNNQNTDDHLDGLILLMHQFRKNCKKRKQNQRQDENSKDRESQNFDCEISSNKNQMAGDCQSTSKLTDQKIDIEKTATLDQKEFEFSIIQQKKVETSKIPTEFILFQTQGTTEINNTQFFSQGQQIKLQLRKIDSLYEQPIFSLFETQSKQIFWENLRQDNFMIMDHIKISEQFNTWQNELQYFSLPYQLRDRVLGSDSYLGSTQIVSKLQMLEASLTLEQTVLKVRHSSYFQQFTYPEFGL